MHARPLRRRPRRRIHARGPLRRVIPLGPVHQQGDRVFGLRRAAQVHGGARARARGHLHGHVSLGRDHGFADVDVVAVQVVRDVGVDARPGLERLELALGLAHVRVEVVEVAEVLGFVAGVRVGWVEALVVLDVHKDAVLRGGVDELLVVGEGLNGGLRDHYVDLAGDGIEGNGVVGCVWCEDGDCVSWAQCIDCRLVRFGIASVVRGEGIEARV